MEKFQLKGAPTCRVAYVQGLFEKRKVKGMEDGKEKYNAFVLVPKDDKEKVEQLLTEFNAAFAELQKKGFRGKTVKAINPKNNCLVDGDEYADEKDGREAFRGYYIIKVSSPQFRPLVVDMQKRVITNGIHMPGLSVDNMSDQELHSGDYVLANLSFWVYNQATFQGIGCNPNAIVKVKDGETIGGVSTNVDDYIDLSSYDSEEQTEE